MSTVTEQFDPVAAANVRQAATHTNTHPFTCGTCQIAFRTGEKQKQHMHTDWHRYNAQRKIAELPPISSDTFGEKVVAVQQAEARAADRSTFEKYCRPCGKTYYSPNSYANHMGSQKHAQAVVKYEALMAMRNDDADSVMSSTMSLGEPVQTNDPEAEAELSEIIKNMKTASLGGQETPSSSLATPSTTSERRIAFEGCLFCPHVSDTFDNNMEHMQKQHSLFIPEQGYLVDLEGLIRHLGRKLGVYNQCIYCNKIFRGLDAVRTHMQDRGHTMIAFDTDEHSMELGNFYDFRSSYPDGDDTSDLEGDEGAKYRKGFKTDDGQDANQEGWSTDSDVESVSSEDIGRIHKDPSPVSSRLQSRRNSQLIHHHADGWHAKNHHLQVIVATETELVMPSGRSAGHRSLYKYYKQNLHGRDLGRVVADIPYPRKSEEDVDYSDTDSDADDEAGNEGTVTRAPPPHLPEWVGRRERGHDLARRDPNGLISRANAGLAGVSGEQRKQLKTAEIKDRRKVQRQRAAMEWKREKMANSQKHFRDPLLQ